MKNILRHRHVILAVRIVIGLIFIYAGALKLSDPLSFADNIASFRILPREFVNILAIGLPVYEIIVGLMLLVGWKLRTGSFCLLILTVIFAVALSQALARGLEVDCGCFGSGKPSIFKTWTSLIRDLFLIAAAALLYLKTLDAALDVSSSSEREGIKAEI